MDVYTVSGVLFFSSDGRWPGLPFPGAKRALEKLKENKLKTISDQLRGLLDSSAPEETRKRVVWARGTPIPGLDPNKWRWDADQNLMCYDDHGQCTEHGWEIDHELPDALGGSDAYANLRPLHWRNNRRRGGLLGSILRDLK